MTDCNAKSAPEKTNNTDGSNTDSARDLSLFNSLNGTTGERRDTSVCECQFGGG